MNKYMLAEKRIAELLGRTNVQVDDENPHRLVGQWPDGSVRPIKAYARDPGYCFKMIVHHHLFPYINVGVVTVHTGTISFIWDEPIREHESEEAAVMYAVACARIKQMERS